jgi:hypothetical protein
MDDMSTENPDLGSEFICAVRQDLAHKALRLQSRQQPMHVALGELQLIGQIRDAARLLAQRKGTM